MYVRRHRVRNVKLLRDVTIDFVDASEQPRMWTVFVRENRLCKTTLLQTIAAAASGSDRGTQLVSDVIASWPDLRNPVQLLIDTEFGFSERRNAKRGYPGKRPSSVEAPKLSSTLSLEPDKRVFGGSSEYVGISGSKPQDPLTSARQERLADWFVAGYGPRRLLSAAGRPRGNPTPWSIAFGRCSAKASSGRASSSSSATSSGARSRRSCNPCSSWEVSSRTSRRSSSGAAEGSDRTRISWRPSGSRWICATPAGNFIKVPAAWLSQGYQSLIAWLADVVGQVLLEAGEPVEAADMEGTVLVDEIDLHLHPTWQVRLIPALKAVFPKLQFIATTHSPMVLPGLKADEIIILSQDAEGSVEAKPSTQSPQLLTGSELFSSFFEIRKLYPDDLGTKLHRYGNLASDPTRSADEDTEMKRLRDELQKAGATFDWEPVARESGA